MGNSINQRNVFGQNVVARHVGLKTTGERWAFAKGIGAAVVAGLLLHYVFGIG